MVAAASELNRFCQFRGAQTQSIIEAEASGFRCSLTVTGLDHEAFGVCTSKRGAQEKAVNDMHQFITSNGLFEEVCSAPPAAKKQKTSVTGSIATASLQAQQPQVQSAPKPVVEDGQGNFTLEVARSTMNMHLQKWRQSSEIKLTEVSNGFKASISFKARRSKYSEMQQFNESHVASQKKTAQNELALKVCRKLFQMGYIPKFKRSVGKRPFSEEVKESKYYQDNNFALCIDQGVKGRLRSFLSGKGYEVLASANPGDVLLSCTEQDVAAENDEVAQQQFARAVEWSPPGSAGRKPWPPPCSAVRAGNVDASVLEVRMSLPVAQCYENIVNVIAGSQVSIIQGSTGSGKTTQVPQYILDAEDGCLKGIICVQPRRIAAITVAQRVAFERGEQLGGSVGYAVRFDSVWPRQVNGICYMTTGLLLKRLHTRGLHGISHVVVDEVHERDVENDLLLTLLRSAVATHPGLKVVLMSATIDVQKFQDYFASAISSPEGVPSLSVEGRVFPVQTYFLEDAVEKLGWTPSKNEKASKEKDNMNECDPQKYSRSTVQTVTSLPDQLIPLDLARDILKSIVNDPGRARRNDNGAVLIFLPGWGLMYHCSKVLQEDSELAAKCHIIMLHSRVPKEEQMQAFKPAPANKTKVIIATNIAESSVTIDDVSVVIDSGRVKLTFFSDATGLSHTQVVWTGRQNMEQRKGRAGRTRPGVCYRLFTRKRFQYGVENAIPPELTRTPLVGSALLVKSLDLGDIQGVLSQCIDPPPPGSINHAISELKLIKALDANLQLTPLGRIIARLPIDPQVGLALLLGHWVFGLGDAMALICSSMSFDEPYSTEKTAGYVPYSIQEKYAGTRKHSDQFLLGLLHQEYSKIYDQQGERAAEEFCRKESLNPVVMRQVRNSTDQLRALLASDWLGAMALGDADETGEAGLENIDVELGGEHESKPDRPRNHHAISDWGGNAWQWGAIQLLLATALPHVAVHQEKRHIWVSEEQLGAVHKGSTNCTKATYVFPSPIFAFLEQMQEGYCKPPRARQVAVIPTTLALLRPFGRGSISLDEDGTHVIVADWIPLGPINFDTVSLLLTLRCFLEDTLAASAEKAVTDRGSLGATGRDMGLLELLKEIVTPASLRQKEIPKNSNSKVASGNSWSGNFAGGGSNKPWTNNGPASKPASVAKPQLAAKETVMSVLSQLANAKANNGPPVRFAATVRPHVNAPKAKAKASLSPAQGGNMTALDILKRLSELKK